LANYDEIAGKQQAEEPGYLRSDEALSPVLRQYEASHPALNQQPSSVAASTSTSTRTTTATTTTTSSPAISSHNSQAERRGYIPLPSSLISPSAIPHARSLDDLLAVDQTTPLNNNNNNNNVDIDSSRAKSTSSATFKRRNLRHSDNDDNDAQRRTRTKHRRNKSRASVADEK
jgi:hypothetical protein